MQTLEEHVQELRKRLFYVVTVFAAATGASFYYSQEILSFFQADLGVRLHSLTAYETFYTQLMIAMLLGFLISLPFTLFQLLKFAKPGLKDKEYSMMRNYLPFSIILFGVGSAFSYQYVVKTSLGFFEQTTSAADVAAVWGLKNTLGFAMKISAFTGIIFQLPIVAVVLAKAGVIDREMMLKYRSYFIVGILLAAAMATPPDILTQILVTAPVIGLYQLSIFLVGRVESSDD